MINSQHEIPETRQQGAEDKKLVLAALQGESAAFTKLVERYMLSIYAVGWSEFHERERAEELTQEVFLRAYLGLKDLHRPEFFPVWIHRIARNLASTWKRNGCRKSKLVQMVPLEESVMEIPDDRNHNVRDRLAMVEEDASLREAVIRLSDDLRQVVLLHFSDELSLSEISRRLGLAPSSVSRRLQRALTLLRADLGNQESVEQTTQKARGIFRPSPQAMARTIAGVGLFYLLSEEAKAAMLAVAATTDGGLTAGVSASEVTNAIEATNTLATTGQSATAHSQSTQWALFSATGKFVTIVAAAALLTGGAGAVFSGWKSFQASAIHIPAPSVDHKPSKQLRTSPLPKQHDTTKQHTYPSKLTVQTGISGATALASATDSVVLPVHVIWEGGGRIHGAEVRCSTLLDYASENRTTETRESARSITTKTTDDRGNVTFSLGKQTARVRLDASFPDAISSGREVTVEPGFPVVLTLQPGYRISGTVYKEEEGQRLPAAGATVTVAGGSSTKSEADGTYTLAGLSGKKAELFATLGAFRAPARRGERQVVQLNSGEDNSATDLVLKPAASLVGSVIDRETGNAVPRARVTAFALPNGPNHLEFYGSNQDQTTVTDNNGMFSLEGLPTGAQKVKVLADGYGDAIKEIELSTGDGNSTLLALEKGGTITVNAVDRDGVPVEGATLNVMRKGGWFLASRTDRNGQVTLPGVNWETPHTLWVWKHSTKSKVKEVVLKTGEANTSVSLDFSFRTAENELPGLITGTIKDAAGRPIQDVAIYVQQAWAVDRDTTGDRYVPNAYGEFRLERRGATGTYYISVAGEGWAPAWAKTEYGTLNEPEHIDFVLKKGHLLKGVVVDSNGAGIAGAAVRPYPLDADIFSYSGHPGMRETVTDEKGAFTLKDLPGSQVMLRSKKSGWLMTTEGGAVVDSNQPVRLTMARAGEIEGRVVDSTGSPVPDFIIQLISEGDIHPRKEQQFLSEDGKFRLSDLVPGQNYNLNAVRVTDKLSSGSRTVRAREMGTGGIAEDLVIPVTRESHGETPTGNQSSETGKI